MFFQNECQIFFDISSSSNASIHYSGYWQRWIQEWCRERLRVRPFWGKIRLFFVSSWVSRMAEWKIFLSIFCHILEDREVSKCILLTLIHERFVADDIATSEFPWNWCCKLFILPPFKTWRRKKTINQLYPNLYL